MSEATPAEAPSIGLQDLQNLLHIVDVSAERGTFKGNELSSVGTIRDKLSNFLEFARQTEEAQREAAAEAAPQDAEAGVPDAPAKPARKKSKTA